MLVLFLIGIFNLLPLSLQQEGDCLFRITDVYSDNQGLFLTEDFEFLYPNQYSNVRLASGEKTIISCHGGSLYSGVGTDNVIIENSTSILECNNSELEIDGRHVAFTTFKCLLDREESTNSSLHNSCSLNTTGVYIGFDINLNNTFVPLVEICFSEETKVPLYVQYNISKAIRYQGSVVLYTSNIIQDDEYYNLGIDVGDLYNYARQKELFNKMLGLPPESDKYINQNYYNYFDESPIASSEVFYQYRQQIGVFRAVNTAPTWMALDNWSSATSAIINYIKRVNEVDLIAVTGTYGISTLPHEETGEDVELYLYVNGNVTAFPAPALLWTLVYEPVGQQAAVLVTVNNIYRVKEEEILCEDATNQTGWVNWKGGDITLGYSYVCTYDDFKNAVPYIPEFSVTGLLTN